MKRGLALISLAIVVALAAVAVAGGAKTQGTTLFGRRQATFVAPLVSTWTPASARRSPTTSSTRRSAQAPASPLSR